MTTALVVVAPDELERMIRSAVADALRGREREPDSEWLDAASAAKVLDVHPRTVAKLALKAGFPARRVGRLLRVRRSELMAWVESGAAGKRGRR